MPSIVPLLTLLVAGVSCWARGPFWLSSNFDPAYCYLINSLHVVIHVSPQHTDHPGTPLQVLGAGVIRFIAFMRGHKPSVDAIGHPELFLNCINFTCVLLYVAVLDMTGRSIRRLTGRLDCMLAFQSTALMTLPGIQALNAVAPEVLLLSIGCGLAWLVAASVLRPARAFGWAWLISVSVLFGLAMATKITCAPLAVLFFLLLPAGYRRGLFLVASALSFLVFTLPIRSQWGRMFGWIVGLALHNGRYGDGDATVIDSSKFHHQLVYTLRQSHVLSGLAIASLIIAATLGLIAIRRRGARWPALVIGAIGLTEVLQILMVAKSPNARYLLPAITLIGAQLVVLIVYGSAVVSPRFKKAFDTGVLCVLSIIWLLGGTTIVRWTLKTARERNEQVAFAAHVQQQYADDLKVVYYRSSSPLFALGFGMDFGHNWKLEAEVLRQHPDLHLYSIFGGLFERSTTPEKLQALLALHRPIVMIGTPDPGKLFPPAGTTARELERRGDQAVSLITPNATSQPGAAK